jgi:hypothetical protein
VKAGKVGKIALKSAFATLLLIGCARGGASETDSVQLQGLKTPSAPAPSHCCTVVGIDTGALAVTARETASGYTFRFAVNNARQLAAIKVADPVWADFGAKSVKLREQDAACCSIMAGPLP